jgi:hypothetical protein
VIFDIVEYIIMEWTMPNEMSRICRRVLILKKRRRMCLLQSVFHVDDQLLKPLISDDLFSVQRLFSSKLGTVSVVN